MPSAIRDQRRLKFEHTMQPAIFLGYVVQPGCKWNREYRYMFIDDIADMSFYRKVRWSSARVPIHSGRELVCEGNQPIVYPCRATYARDNDTLEGVRRGEEEVARSKEEPQDDDDENGPHSEEVEEDDLADTCDGEETAQGPRHVEFEPFPNEAKEEMEELMKEETRLAWMYDYLSTDVDPHGHSLDQYGVRIQKTSRPPYVHPDEWLKTKTKDKEKIIKDFKEGASKLKEVRDKIHMLKGVIEEHYRRGGLRPVARNLAPEFAAAAEHESCGGSASTGRSQSASRDSVPTDAWTRKVDPAAVAMPVINQVQEHRPLDDSPATSFYACTARPVDRNERNQNKDAQAALKKEWDRLRSCGDRGCWDESNPRERQRG